MTTQEVQEFITQAITSKYKGVTYESGEITTGPEGDGRFFGTVSALRYDGMLTTKGIFLAIGETEQAVQIVRFGNSECLQPSEVDLNAMLLKEMGIKNFEEELDAE